MSDWLLDDEEQRIIVGRHYEVQRDIGQPALAMVIADLIVKAEAKKLVERLDNLFWGGVQKGSKEITITLKFWETLKKEVEDG